MKLRTSSTIELELDDGTNITVTNNSDSKSRKMIRHARKLNKDACIVAMGCFIEYNKDNISDIMPEIDIIIGNKDKSIVVDLIKDYMLTHNKIKDLREDFDSNFEDMFIDSYNTRTRAFVKIQDGCENFCSYCVIPRVRGRCRSKQFDVAVKEVETLVKNGYKEIVLTGIHTGNYGVDIGTNFAALLGEIVKIDGLKRLRISSIEITRDNNYNIEIKNIKFTEEFISKSTKDYIDYLNELLTDNNIGITYKEQINKEKLLELEKDYTVMSLVKMENNLYSEEELNNYMDLMKEHFYVDGIINCPYIEGNNIVDTLILIPKTEIIYE